MLNQFVEMDAWNSEQVAQFKETGRLRGLENLQEAMICYEAVNRTTLVAEGDSWFDYSPGTDLIDCLRNHYNYLIDNYAQAGDTLENMIYGSQINNRFERVPPTIDRVLMRLKQLQPKVFLFSGGGNDVAGQGFESYLNHKNSGLPILRVSFVNDMINVVFRQYWEDLITKVETVSPETHIITHGYGYTPPTGKGVEWLFLTFCGPWLKPTLIRKGILDPIEQREVIFTVLDQYNQMLFDLAQKHDKFHYVDLRPLIDQEKDWVNELHLRNSAYARVAEKFHLTIQAVFS